MEETVSTINVSTYSLTGTPSMPPLSLRNKEASEMIPIQERYIAMREMRLSFERLTIPRYCTNFVLSSVSRTILIGR
jgi:hypothetical protein